MPFFQLHRRANYYLFVAFGLVAVYSFYRGGGWQGTATLHTVMEAVATMLALVVGSIALLRYYSRKNTIFLIIGVGFLGTGFLDGYHALVTSAFLKPFMPSDLPALIPWSWVASRQFLSMFLALSWFVWWLEDRQDGKLNISEWTVYFLSTLFTLASFLFFAFFPLPAAYYPELFFHRPEELLPAIFFLIALIGYIKKGSWKTDLFEHWLVMSLVIGFVSQAVFMSFSGTLFDLEFDAAHSLKKISYICVLIGLGLGMLNIFKREEILFKELENQKFALNAHAIVSIADTNGAVTYCNDAFSEITGYTREELLGQKYDILQSGEHSDQFFIDLQKTISRGQIWQGQIKNTKKNGDTFWVQTTIVPVLNEAGIPFEYIAIRTDITDNKLLMDKLHLERNLLQATKENIGQGLSVFDKDLKLVMANENFRKILDYPEDLVEPGTPYEDIVRYNIERRGDVDPNSSVEELVKEAIDFSSRSEALKFEREFKNGKIIRVSGNPMPDGGFVHTYLDITDQKQMEDDLIQAKENAEKATSAKSNFLATMSHEIRTPLNGVLGMAQLLHSTELNADQTTKVDNILSSGTSLLEILNDILDMSKIEAGNMQLEECVFDLGELINSVSEPFIILSNDRNITFEINELDVATTLVKGDKTRLRQILQNLLSNAFKFTFSGKITISTFLVEKNATVDGCNLFRIDVEDTGEGIAPDRTSSVFDVFVQEDDTITRKFGGSGLGLSIVRNLIELMDGEIKLTSEVGVGSKFSIFLPFQKVTENEKTSYVQNDQPKTIDAILPLKILVAEDNMVNAMITKAMLEQGGHNVEFAVNGKIAVDYLKKDMPDVILMDVHMPIMSGIEATEIIRSTHDHSKLPIIGVTAEAFSERIAQLREVGMNDVLTKPFTRDQLNAILLEYGSPKVLQ